VLVEVGSGRDGADKTSHFQHVLMLCLKMRFLPASQRRDVTIMFRLAL